MQFIHPPNALFIRPANELAYPSSIVIYRGYPSQHQVLEPLSQKSLQVRSGSIFGFHIFMRYGKFVIRKGRGVQATAGAKRKGAKPGIGTVGRVRRGLPKRTTGLMHSPR